MGDVDKTRAHATRAARTAHWQPMTSADARQRPPVLICNGSAKQKCLPWNGRRSMLGHIHGRRNHPWLNGKNHVLYECIHLTARRIGPRHEMETPPRCSAGMLRSPSSLEQEQTGRRCFVVQLASCDQPLLRRQNRQSEDNSQVKVIVVAVGAHACCRRHSGRDSEAIPVRRQKTTGRGSNT